MSRRGQAHKAVARLQQLNPALRVANLKDVLGPKTLRDTRKDCGKPDCPNDHRSHGACNAATERECDFRFWQIGLKKPF
jgi:hypothetical protein